MGTVDQLRKVAHCDKVIETCAATMSAVSVSNAFEASAAIFRDPP